MNQARQQGARPRRDDTFLETLTADSRKLRALARELRQAVGDKRSKAQADFAALHERSKAAVAERRSRLPKPEFQSDLPVNERRADIAELIAKHQVVIVCGETARARRRSCRISASISASAPAVWLATPSRAGWPPVRWRRGWRRS